jgi:nucleotide-binding universal stress UspA family protein
MTVASLVVPLDGSPFAERALPVAREVATRLGCGLILVRTAFEGDEERPIAYLEQIAATCNGIPVQLMALDKHPAAQAIMHAAAAGPDRVVCMTTHGYGALRWALLGSVAEEVLRTRHEPTLLIGRHCAEKWSFDGGPLVVAVYGDNVADPIIATARDWAKMLGLDVVVVRVDHPLDESSAERADAVLNAIADWLRAQGVSASVEVVRHSFTPGAIVDVAQQSSASLLAVNSNGRHGIGRLALGSVAMGVAGLSPCPVLVAPMAGGAATAS